MAITIDAISDLKSIVKSLHDRVEQLERELKGGDAAEGLRMILIGPPGAGAWIPLFRTTGRRDSC